ncbi:hypothetical protein GCM10010327_51900 [Streptomyces nitrosporeus]|nr:hypothetical protein GCM10010327_51900 [Streptomyces nitrosporeus]
MQRLLPGAEGADSQALDRGGELMEHRDPLLGREPPEEVVDACGEGESGVSEGQRMVRHVRVP